MSERINNQYVTKYKRVGALTNAIKHLQKTIKQSRAEDRPHLSYAFAHDTQWSQVGCALSSPHDIFE